MKHLFFVGSILLAGLMLSAAPRPAAAQIVIDNVTELEDINSNLSGDYVLGADINAAGANFTPIGETCSASGQGCFTGVLDGNGYTISNLTIQQFNLCCAGLFYLISPGGTVDNFQLTNVDIGGYIVGAIASENLGTITQSSVTGTVSGGEFIGGIAGANLGTISQSSMTGTVSGLGLPDAVGGLVGQNSTSHTPSGLFAGNIQQSYSTAAITGGANSTIGGLVGLNGNLSTISQSYSAGSVTGGEMGDVGGLVGANSGGAIGQSYWDTQTSGQGTGVGYNFPPVATGTGLTTAQLQSGLPSGFDPTVWSSRANVNHGFPCLLGVTPGCAPPAIATNQYASPCLNSSSGCLGGSSVNLSSDIDLTKTPTPNLLVGTGGGTGSLTVGPATLTASSVVLGVSSAGSGAVQSGGTLQTSALTVGGPSTGSLNNVGTVNVSGDTIIGDGATGTMTQTGNANTTMNNLIIGHQIGSNGTYTLGGTGSLTVNGNMVLGAQPGASGTFNMNAGPSDVATATVVGTLTVGGVLGQGSGTVSAPNLMIGSNAAALSALNVSGTVNVSGNSTVQIGNSLTIGQFTGSESPLTI